MTCILLLTKFNLIFKVFFEPESAGISPNLPENTMVPLPVEPVEPYK